MCIKIKTDYDFEKIHKETKKSNAYWKELEKEQALYDRLIGFLYHNQ